MKRVLVIAGVLACSSGNGGGSDPTALTDPIAQNVTISQITILQSLEVPVMQNGSSAIDARGGMTTAYLNNPSVPYTYPLVAQRDSILRVYVTPESGFSSHALTARARIVTTTPTGLEAQVFSGTATISTPSQQFDLTSTINIPIPGVALERGASITVVLNDKTGDSPSTPSSGARWPQDGSLADLDAHDGGDKLRVMIVPVQYNADGSHRLPDTSDAQIESYRQRFYQVYPVAQVEITVRDPWPWSGAISPNGNGMDTILQALAQLRSSDQPDPDVYYYAAFDPASSFGAYCGGGCVTGLSNQPGRTSVGIGYGGGPAEDTAIHEVGHAHNLPHAPCGGAAGPDPAFPYTTGAIGVWGYDPFGQQMIDAGKYKDMMGYCDPKWISDYNYGKLFKVVRTDNGYFNNDWMRGPGNATRYVPAGLDLGGGTVRVNGAAAREPWITQGEPREITWAGGSATAYFFPFDHLPGGTLYVPEEVPSGARLHGTTIATILR
jgi:hypothetical protein